MFPHLHETPINKMIQKKFVLNVILLVLSEIQFGHQGVGTSKKQRFRGVFRLIWYFYKYFQTFFFQTLFRFGLRTSKGNTIIA